MSDSDDPSRGDASMPHAEAGVRAGAALVFDLGDGRAAAALCVAAQMSGRLLTWARDPDLYVVIVRASADTTPEAGGRGGPPSAIDGVAWELDCFSKPMITLLPASPSSAALALALAGTHRVAGERFACAIDDVGRGEVPPGLVMHALSRLPDGIGAYLMLTGCIIGAADAHELGLVTHCIAEMQGDAIVAALADADPIDPVLDERHEIKGARALEPLIELIARHFVAGSVADIAASLGSERGQHRMWAATTAVQIAAAPTAAATAALHVLAQARLLDGRETSILVARASALLLQPGASRLDAATWATRLAAVHAGDLKLPSRTELQSLRRPA